MIEKPDYFPDARDRFTYIVLLSMISMLIFETATFTFLYKYNPGYKLRLSHICVIFNYSDICHCNCKIGCINRQNNKVGKFHTV